MKFVEYIQCGIIILIILELIFGKDMDEKVAFMIVAASIGLLIDYFEKRNV